jgi:hypothetical protein
VESLTGPSFVRQHLFESTRRRGPFEYLLVAGSGGLTAALFVIGASIAPDWQYDRHAYLDVARGTGALIPFSLRLLTPWLATLLPLTLPAAFTVLNAVGAAMATALFAGHVLWLGVRRRAVAAAVVTLVTLYYPFGYLALAPVSADGIFFLSVMAAVIAIAHDRPMGLAAVLAIGVLNKEAIIGLAVVYAIVHARRETVGRVVATSIAVVLPAVAIYVLIALIEPVPVLTKPLEAGDFLIPIFAFRPIASAALFAAVPVWLCVAAGWANSPPIAQRLLKGAAVYVLVLCVLSGTDIGRMAGVLAFFWIPIVIGGWERDARLWLWTSVVAAANIMLTTSVLWRDMSIPLKVVAATLLTLPVVNQALHGGIVPIARSYGEPRSERTR